MSDETPKKKKKDQANTMLFQLVKSQDEAENDGFGSNGAARRQAGHDLKSINRAINLFDLELKGFREEQNVGLNVELENWQLNKKGGLTTIGLGSASGVTGLLSLAVCSGVLGVASAGLGLVAFVPMGLRALLHNNRRLVKKDYQGDTRSERDIQFEYGSNEIHVPVTPGNMDVIAQSYEAASLYLQSVRREFFRGKKTKEEVSEGVRKTITDYILDHAAKATIKPMLKQEEITSVTLPRISGGMDVDAQAVPNSGLATGPKTALRGIV